MAVSRTISLLAVGITLSLLSNACAVAPVPVVEPFGCHDKIRGVMAIIQAETSRLSCRTIKEFTADLPSEPEVYFIQGESRLLWKCRFYGVDEQPVLVRCQHHKRHFTIVRSAP
jgi:hypothetical protein